MNLQDENQDTVPSAVYNPFPEPQTIPFGWDTSELFSMPQGEADVVEEDSNQS